MTGTGLVSIIALAINAFAIAIAWQADKSDALIALLGMAGANGTAAVNFWLGSSAGSRAKDHVIAGK